ncbi:MAG: hypothetical protein ABI488_24515 [Polyangiaceae bacterium]
MNKSIALILSLLATSFTVGCGGSDSSSAGASGSGGAGDSGGETSSKAGADNSAAGDSSVGDSSAGDTGNNSDAGSPGDTGGSSSGGESAGAGTSSGGNGDGAAGAPNPSNADCKKLETCCVNLTSGSDGTDGPKGACEHIVGLNYGPSCQSTYSLYKCDAVLATAALPKSSACKIGTQCMRSMYNAAIDSACSGAAMGAASVNCPAEGVIACCKLTGVIESCFYEGDSSPISESDCTAENGTFSTTP